MTDPRVSVLVKGETLWMDSGVSRSMDPRLCVHACIRVTDLRWGTLRPTGRPNVSSDTDTLKPITLNTVSTVRSDS